MKELTDTEFVEECRRDAVAAGARGLLEHRIPWPLTASANDESMRDAIRDAEVVLVAAENAGIITYRGETAG